MKKQYVNDIIAAIKLSDNTIDVSTINEDTKFSDIPDMDSMSIVNFQINLASIIGEKANSALPVLEMSIGEYAQLLEEI